MDTISGQLFKDMLISGTNAINTHKQEVNELNVFPVPDGDTGTNMSMTMSASMRELNKLPSSTSITEVAETAASALLRGARGNSGVILSLLFRGIAKGLKDKTDAKGTDIATALKFGVESAYKAVMKPAEGTILTVAREAAQAAETVKGNAVSVFETVVETAKTTLAKTPDMLPVLKKAGVVDAGGKGLAIIFEAMLYTLKGNGILEGALGQPQYVTVPEFGGAAGESEEEINFTYCTEFIIIKTPESKQEPLMLRAYLESIGDCVLVADDSTFIKVHVHTDNPGNAIQEALGYGYLTDLKIDNMRLQHEKKAAMNMKPDEPLKESGFVVIAAGSGIANLFSELGADKIVEGGQTMNPSTEDILKAIESVPAENVIVLPNNKNIILAAEQTIALATRKVHVLHTKTIPQGIAAMLSFDTEADLNTNLLGMEAAADKVGTGLVTFAARDSDFDGHKIKKDEILALSNGKLNFVDNDPVNAAVKLTKNLSDKNTSYITILYGEGVTDEQAESAKEQISEKLGSQVEINVINGGQPIYYFIISVE